MVAAGLIEDEPSRRVEVLAAPASHCGLGTGTQLALAVAAAMLRLSGKPLPDLPVLAQCIGRGCRSAIGTHGFARGGLIVDAGKSSPDAVAPLAERVELPSAWRVVLLLPMAGQGIAGDVEERAFARLPPVAAETSARLRQLAFDEIVPAARAGEFSRFAEGVARFNALSGDCYAPVQGGPYASANARRWVDRLAAIGAPAGQSSWGPTLFAFAMDDARARELAESIERDAAADGWRTLVTRPLGEGAAIVED
jgi:beta-RFAP synthase